MRFRSKLFRRMAITHAVTFGSVVLVTACEPGVIAESTLDFVRVISLPPEAIVVPQQRIRFQGLGLSDTGDTVNVGIVWSSSAGDVDEAGLYTAPDSAGEYLVVATSERKTWLSDTSLVVVITDEAPPPPPPASVASVAVTPTAASIGVGGTTQLAATPRDAGGNVLTGRTLTWSSGSTAVATVSASGVVTGAGVGTATITATVEGVSGTATVTVSAAPAPVANVSVSPSTSNVETGETVQLAATTTDAAGNVLTGRTVTWSSSESSVATVNSGGLVTGIASGTVSVTASSEGQSGSATITVTRSAVASLTVSPSTATAFIGGGVLQLTAEPRNASGNVLSGRTVTWSSSNTAVATVSATGGVSAVSEGTVTITATSEGVSGTATVTAATATWFEPTGFTTITDRAFNALATCRDGNSRIDGWDDVEACSGRFSIVQDQDAPISPSSVLQVYYPEGFVAGSAPGTGQRFWSESLGYRKLYVRFPLKLSADFHGHRSTTNKIQHIWLGSAGGNRVFTRVVGTDANPLEFQIALQGVPDSRTRLRPNQGVSGIIDRSSWYTIEMVFELNTPGVANGVARAWLNGQLLIEYTDVLYQTSSEDFVFTQLQISPTWGGGDDIAPNDFELWVDHTYISAMR